MDNIEKVIEKYYEKNEPIVLACSTGPDSMYILYKILETKYAKNLVACYFNHKLRKEADKEEKFIEDLAKERGFKVEIASGDIKAIRDKFYPSMGIEEVARNKRYEFFNAILNIYKTDKVITGHHLDDKIETFFFNLARGSKLTGLINMTEKSGPIIRPLLGIEKAEVMKFLVENDLKFSVDESNFDTDITRNKLRHDIIPQFKDINTAFKGNISNLMNYLEEVKEMIDFQIEDFLKEQGIKIFNSKKYRINTLEIYGYFYIKDFNELPTLLQKEVIRKIYFISNDNSTIGLSESNISEIIKFINGKNNKTIKVIRKLEMRKENEIIIF